MTINTETLETLGTRIDYSEQVRLAGCEDKLGYASIAITRSGIANSHGRAVKNHFAIDQVVIGRRRRVTTFVKWGHN